MSCACVSKVHNEIGLVKLVASRADWIKACVTTSEQIMTSKFLGEHLYKYKIFQPFCQKHHDSQFW